MDLATLAAHEEIRSLKARYCQYVDQKRWAELALLFAADAELTTERDGATHTHAGREAIGAAIRRALATARTIHHATNPLIRLTSPGMAEATWTVSYTNENGPTSGHGHYVERCALQDGRWVYVQMILRVDFTLG